MVLSTIGAVESAAKVRTRSAHRGVSDGGVGRREPATEEAKQSRRAAGVRPVRSYEIDTQTRTGGDRERDGGGHVVEPGRGRLRAQRVPQRVLGRDAPPPMSRTNADGSGRV